MKLMFVAFYSYLVVVALRLAVWTIGGLVATNGSLPSGSLESQCPSISQPQQS